MKRKALSLTAAILAAGTAAAAEEHRQLGPHEHGHGTLNMAIENNRVTFELDVPGMDIVGFEHKPGTPEEKATAERAEKLLAQGLGLFKLPAAAQCKLVDAKVAIEAEGDHEHEEPADGAKTGAGTTSAQSPAGGEAEHGEHNDYNASYSIDCAKPSAITTIALDYFKSFAGAQRLTINVVTSKSQSTFEASRDKPVVDLGGMM